MTMRKSYPLLALIVIALVVAGQPLILAGFLLALREGIEAALVVSIALGVLKLR